MICGAPLQNRERTGVPRAGSPLGVVDATGSKTQPYVALITYPPDPRLEKARNAAVES